MITKRTINEKITAYFLKNTRITLLALISLLVVGLASFFTMRLTGFPQVQTDIVIVRTLYLGASSNTVLEQVTRPLENSIKSIDEVDSYSSNSQNNISVISITLKPGSNVDSFISKVNSNVASINLPDQAEKPVVSRPSTSGPDFIYAVVRKDNVDLDYKQIGEIKNVLRKDIEKNAAVSSVNFSKNVTDKVVITYDINSITQKGFTLQNITDTLKGWDQTIPVSSGSEINNKLTGITLSINDESLNDLKNLPVSNATGGKVKLLDLTSVEIQSLPDKNIDENTGFYDNGEYKVRKGFKISINLSSGTDVSVYEKDLDSTFAKYFDNNSNEFKNLPEATRNIFEDYRVVEILNTSTTNKEQVQEVAEGLFGLKLAMPEGLEIFGYFGFLLGGIQLVFFVMLAMVSWRSAIISALAIPLSFLFSLIAVRIAGVDLNTLVLFSLVLVIGLVVDPALVVLESIQRQIDIGKEGKIAVLDSIKEVGSGLFLAVFTSIIVFVPFGVVSGFFGQIISYIPLTIIPALIGSYIIPLVFLTWLSTKILKRNKNASIIEEDNLWLVAKWMSKYTKWILTPGWKFVLGRVILILVAISLPFIIANFFTSSGAVKFVQFAQPEENSFLFANIIHQPQLVDAKYSELDNLIVSTITQNKNIDKVALISGVGTKSQQYYIALKPIKERENNVSAKEVEAQLNEKLNSALGDKVFYSEVRVGGVGGPVALFPVSIAIKSEDPEVRKNVAKDLTEILNKVCANNSEIIVDSNCSDSNKVVEKVDNGYEGSETSFVEVKLIREKLSEFGVNRNVVLGILASQFQNANTAQPVTNLKDLENDIQVVLSSKQDNIYTLDKIKSIIIFSNQGPVNLDKVAEIGEVQTVDSIRRIKGETTGVVNAKAKSDFTGQREVSLIQSTVINEFNKNYASKYSSETIVTNFSEGASASINKSFSELITALLLAILLTYIVLVIFFNSFLQPIVILFAIPLTFIGIFPALATFAGGQLGLLEVIGLIILVGIVENVAIFLIDAANQKVKEGWSDRDAIAYAVGVRFRPIMLTKITTLVSTLPLAILSDFYRSLSVVIIFGLLTSGFLSLFTSPILYIFFRNISKGLRNIISNIRLRFIK